MSFQFAFLINNQISLPQQQLFSSTNLSILDPLVYFCLLVHGQYSVHLVALLVLVVPPIKVNVEHRNRSSGQARQQIPVQKWEENVQIMRFQLKLDVAWVNLLLIVRQRQRPNTAAAHGERVQRRQVERPPHLDDAPVAGRHQIFTVSRQQDALQQTKREEVEDKIH